MQDIEVRAMSVWDPVPFVQAPGWCGPICVERDDLIFRDDHYFKIRMQDRPWEMLRYEVLAVLAEVPPAEPLSDNFHNSGLRQLSGMWRRLHESWPLAVLTRLSWTEASECPQGLFTLRAAHAAAKVVRPDGMIEIDAHFIEQVPDMISKIIHDAHVLTLAFCSGWPLFGLLKLLGSIISLYCSTNSCDGSGVAIQDLHRRHFGEDLSSKCRQDSDQSLNDTYSSGDDIGEARMLAADIPVGALRMALRQCASGTPLNAFSLGRLGDCLFAGAQVLEAFHQSQGRSLFGLNVCPVGSVGAWLDQQRPAPPFPLCVRTEANTVDEEIRKKGGWGECSSLWSMLSSFGVARGCTILDVGANIGACTLMLAIMGLSIIAFEPLPRNADLLEASLQLNGIRNVRSLVEFYGSQEERAGKVSVQRYALGHKTAVGRLSTRKRNAGDTRIFYEEQTSNCNESDVSCPIDNVPLLRFDDFIDTSSSEFVACLLKIDVQGGEFQVLKGMLNAFRNRVIGLVYFEWRPEDALRRGENPLEAIVMLDSVGYVVLAPAAWFGSDPLGERWHTVRKEDFQIILQHIGNLLAVATRGQHTSLLGQHA